MPEAVFPFPGGKSVTAAKGGIPTTAVGVIGGYIGGNFEGISVPIGEQSPSGRSVYSDKPNRTLLSSNSRFINFRLSVLRPHR